MKRLLALVSLASTLVLCGCASTFTSKISTNNQLNATSDNLDNKSFAIQTDPQAGDDVNFKLAYDEVSARLKELGFEAMSEDKAAIKVSVQLAIIPGNAHVSAPFSTVSFMVTPSGMVIPLGSFRDPFWPAVGRYPFRYPFYSRRWGGWYSPWYSPFSRFDTGFFPEPTVRQYFDHEITIALHDAASGKLLYSVKASSNQSDTEIGDTLHLLVETALREFPLKSGETKVELKLEHN
ncbi:MAG: DUF4136 domain-containing protein [Burkholderiales bacterium]|nr:DUF4136 domain-containing protein [Burkholderiales bacterium]